MMEPENTTAPLTPNTTGLPDHPEWDHIHAVVPPYLFALCAFGLPANAFVLLVFLVHKDRLTTPEIYLGNLALTDILLLVCLPFWGGYILNHFDWPYGEFLCKAVNSSIVVNFYTGVFTLAMISIDRYMALVRTMETRRLRRTLYAKVVCVHLWLVGLVMSAPVVALRKVEEFFETPGMPGTLACILDYPEDDHRKLAHQVLLNMVGFLLPILVIVFCSASIVRTLNKRRRSVNVQEANDSKATALVYAVTALFLFCWGPFQLFTFLDTLCDVGLLDEDSWSHALDVGHQVSTYTAFLNSALNPLLYVFSGQYFRRKVAAIYRRTRHRRLGSDRTTYQRSVVSTYLNKTEQIKPVVIPTLLDNTW